MWIDDQILENHRDMMTLKVFVPESTFVVLGSGNDADLEVHAERCSELSIPVLRRYGGGGAVVLYPGCCVVSIGCWVKEQFQNGLYFRLLNGAVISALEASSFSIRGLSQNGISDIAFGEKKIAGTSMFRSRNYLLYQASILVNLEIELVSSLLRHPSKEPEYRKGRSHGGFLTDISTVANDSVSPSNLASQLEKLIPISAKSKLYDQLLPPIDSQMSALEARLLQSRMVTIPNGIS